MVTLARAEPAQQKGKAQMKQQDNQTQQAQTEKKPYVQPKLVRHGNVETLTLGQIGGPSGPIYT